MFEPKVALEVDGRNGFKLFGLSDSGPVVIMDFLIEGLGETLRMLQNMEQGIEEETHEFGLTASLFVITLRRRGEELELVLVDEGKDPTVSQVIGRGNVGDWVRAFATLADEILDLLQRLNPTEHTRLSEDLQDIRRLKVWLTSHPRSG